MNVADTFHADLGKSHKGTVIFRFHVLEVSSNILAVLINEKFEEEREQETISSGNSVELNIL